jgi:hypothetical protein
MPTLLLLQIVASCAKPIPYIIEPALPPNKDDKALMDKLSTLYPKEFKLKHRVIITARGKQFDLTGFLIFRQPDSYYAAAYVEAGAPVFEMVHANGKERVLRKPKYMPELYLQSGIMRDLLHLYANKNSIGGEVIARDDEGTRFVFPRGIFLQEYLVNKHGTLFSSRTGFKGELKRTVRYSQHKEYEGFMLPTSIYLENYDVRYKMNIQLLEIDTKIPVNFDEKIRLTK